MSAWHVEIRDVREDGDYDIITQVDCEVRRVSDIECVRSADYVGIIVNKESTATGYLTQEQAKHGVFKAYRRPLEGGDETEIKVTS